MPIAWSKIWCSIKSHKWEVKEITVERETRTTYWVCKRCGIEYQKVEPDC